MSSLWKYGNDSDDTQLEDVKKTHLRWYVAAVWGVVPYAARLSKQLGDRLRSVFPSNAGRLRRSRVQHHSGLATQNTANLWDHQRCTCLVAEYNSFTSNWTLLTSKWTSFTSKWNFSNHWTLFNPILHYSKKAWRFWNWTEYLPNQKELLPNDNRDPARRYTIIFSSRKITMSFLDFLNSPAPIKIE